MAEKASLPVALWGVGGVLALLGTSVVRLSGQVMDAFAEPLEPLHYGVGAAWLLFMVYAEGWRGFHKQFSPRVVQRAFCLPSQPLLAVLAPAVCMGFLHATKKRKIVAYTLVAFIILLILGVSQLSQPWRGVVDLGVVAGLSVGAASIFYHLVRAIGGELPGVPADFPEK